jgi:UDP-glucuronate 4-epimerase
MVNKRIFITGAAGFIGFHLAKHAKKQGDEVVGFDNFNDYYDPQLKRDRAKELEKLDITMIDGDLNNSALLESSIFEFRPTHLVHLAAQAGVRYSLVNPEIYLRSNIDGFLNILEICRKNPSIILTYASSSSVYGCNKKTSFSIEDTTEKPASLYGATKKSNELMAHAYHHLFGIHCTGLRFFTVYGPWGRPDMAYFSFTKAILEGRPIDVYNFGEMQRDFTYIDDIIDGTYSAMNLAAPCAIFNLGHHHPEELLHLIKVLESELGIKAKKNLLPMQAGDVIRTFADIKESQLELGFHPKVTLERGLHNFIKWYQDYYK